MKIFKNLSKTRVLSAFTMIEIMIGLVIVAVAIIPVIGVMSSTNRASGHGEAMIQAADYCRNIMDTLLNDVRFKCLLPGGIPYGHVKKQLATLVGGGGQIHTWAGWASANMGPAAGSNPTLLQDKAGWDAIPGTNGPLICLASGNLASDDKYMKGLLHEDGWATGGTTSPKWTYRDERGTLYYINVSVRIVPLMFRYLNTTEYSWGNGNVKTNSGADWGISYFPDETKSGVIDYVFGDEPVDSSNHSGTPPLWLQGDVPDARMKKIVVSVFWTERMVKTKSVKSYSLISFKAKLED
ncbi:hypothetical protein KAJ27_19795 [bacterium]|nr:hypothetical protein [bacterium]